MNGFKDCTIAREDRILGNIHLEVAIRYAHENYRKGRMISRSLWNEILLYLSLQRQVYQAFGIIGVKDYTGRVVKVEFSEKSVIAPEIAVTPVKWKYWGVKTEEELLERMAIFHLENF